MVRVALLLHDDVVGTARRGAAVRDRQARHVAAGERALDRSTAELARRRDTVLSANRQIAGVPAWLRRHGADDPAARFWPRIERIEVCWR
ncbi:MAG: hypothetical protein ACRDJW_11365 [Thermomicrobiales bacterium]